MPDSQSDLMRSHFLGWQCRVRQIAMRQNQGRPSAGMRPRVVSSDGQEISAAMTVVLVPMEPEESTEFFRFQIRKTHDHKQTYEKGLEYMQSTHFQNPKSFSDVLTAVFNTGSPMAEALYAAGDCALEFAQFSQKYRFACTVRALTPGDPAFEASYWHNRIFNPAMPAEVTILALQPDWATAQAEPPV